LTVIHAYAIIILLENHFYLAVEQLGFLVDLGARMVDDQR